MRELCQVAQNLSSKDIPWFPLGCSGKYRVRGKIYSTLCSVFLISFFRYHSLRRGTLSSFGSNFTCFLGLRRVSYFSDTPF